MNKISKPIVGITTGDLNGIGLELFIKTFSDNRLIEFCTPVIFCSNKAINFYSKLINDQFKYYGTKDLTKINPKAINVFHCWEEDVLIEPGKITEQGGKYAIRSLEIATQCLKDKQIDVLLTNPIDKSNVQSAQFSHTGHTPYFKEFFGANDVAMMLCADNLRVALVTEHVPIAQISEKLTIEKIISKAQIINKSLIEDFGIDRPKIAILALNPHAGDKGLVGNEEEKIISPAIEKLNQQKILSFGPYSADAFFARQQYLHFDCVLAMYHDQGLIPFKSLDDGKGVNFTAGLPFIRTSPDHGTAFDIAGKNEANFESFLEALYYAIDIFHQRNGYKENTADKLLILPKDRKLKKSKEDVEQD